MKELFKQLRAMTWRKSIICAIIVLVIYTAVSGFIDARILPIGLVLIIAYIIAAMVLLRFDLKTDGLVSENSAMLGITMDFVTKLRSPVIIIGFDGTINWYNTAFVAINESHLSSFGKTPADAIDPAFSPQRINQLKEGATFLLNYKGTDYEISGYSLQSNGKNFCMIVFDDRSELVKTKKQLADKNAVVALIVLDNLGDSFTFSQDKYRNATAHIAGLVSEWGKSLDGMVKEYDRDKFIVVFEEKQLQSVLNSKFDILDSIRETELDELTSPITASIGISNIKGSLAEKEDAARNALELALQRGGDQSVLKTAETTEYYGGKTKTVQKKTKIRSRTVAGDLVKHIKQSGNVLIMGHKFSDHDSIASCVAMARIASSYGKTAKIVVNLHDTNLKPIFSKMRGYNYYDGLFTDAPAAQDMIRSDTLLIICDTNNPDLFESREIYENCVSFIIIDHHRKVQEDYILPPKLAYIEPSASSASEMICEIAEYAIPSGSLTKIEAELLFAGIILDTNNFKKNTGVGTFSAALYLRSQGADPNEAQGFFRTNLDEFVYEADIESNISIYRDNIIIATTDIESSDAGQTKVVSSKSADRLLNISGVDAVFVLATVGRDINISARSTDKINVQLVMESLGGGGHFDSAGAFLRDTELSEAVELLKAEINNIIKNKTDNN